MMKRGFACALPLLAVCVAAAQEKRAPGPPVLILPGQVEVSYTGHWIEAPEGKIPSWTFISKGLAKYGQREIVFSLRWPSGWPSGKTIKDVAPEIFAMFDSLIVRAQSGISVKAYDASIITQDGPFLGQKGAWGLIFIPAEMFEGVEIPFEALAAVLIKGDEIEVMSKSSPLRIASMLGAASGYYPCPPWSDIERKPVVSATQFAKSILNASAVTRMPGLMVTQSLGLEIKNFVVLNLESTAMQRLNDYLAGLPEAFHVALMTDPDPEATLRRAWTPGSPSKIIFSEIGNKMTGSFIAFRCGPRLKTGGKELEDGFELTLDSKAWKVLKDVLVRGKSIALRLTDEDLIVVKFVQTFSVDNLAGTIFIPKDVLVLQPQEKMEIRPGDPSLPEYVQKFEKAIQESLRGSDLGDARGLMVAIGIKPGGQRAIWREAVQGHLPEASLEKLDSAFSAIPVIEVMNSAVAFVLKGTLKDRTVTAFPEYPPDWTKALAAAGLKFTGVVDLFKLIWKD